MPVSCCTRSCWPRVSCAITGIGHINRAEPEDDQVAVNLSASVSDLATELGTLGMDAAGFSTAYAYAINDFGTAGANNGFITVDVFQRICRQEKNLLVNAEQVFYPQQPCLTPAQGR